MSFCKRKISSKNSAKTATWKLVPDPIVFAINQAQLLLENEIFEVIYLYQICISKTTEISPNQHADLFRIIFTENSLKIKKGLELVARPHFS